MSSIYPHTSCPRKRKKRESIFVQCYILNLISYISYCLWGLFNIADTFWLHKTLESCHRILCNLWFLQSQKHNIKSAVQLHTLHKTFCLVHISWLCMRLPPPCPWHALPHWSTRDIKLAMRCNPNTETHNFSPISISPLLTVALAYHKWKTQYLLQSST